MRAIGYILLIYGFIVVMLSQMTAKETAIHTSSENRNKIEVKDSFTKSEVEDAILSTALSVAFRCRSSPIGPLSMIAGGVFLDIASRRRKEPSPTPST